MTEQRFLGSNGIFEVIERVAYTSSKKEKEALLGSYLCFQDFRDAMVYCYDPAKNYYVAEKSLAGLEVGSADGRPMSEADWKLLDELSSRSIAGSKAIEVIEGTMLAMSAESAELFKRILLKDMRAGFGASTLNKAQRGLINDPPYMRCSLPAKSNMDKWDWSKGQYVQLKADGMFANVDVFEDGEVVVTTRQGSIIPNFALEDSFVQEARQRLPREHRTIGEMLVATDGKILPREISNGIMNSLQNGGALPEKSCVVFMAWDCMPLVVAVSGGRYELPYETRLKLLVSELARTHHLEGNHIGTIRTNIVFSKAEAYEFYKAFLKEGQEGAVVKSRDGIWFDGTSKDQVKLKIEVPVELEIVGFNEGTGKYVGSLGSLICQSACGQLVVNVNGRTDALRQEIWDNRLDWLGGIVTVKANAIMAPIDSESGKHSLFLPVYVERRLDKSTADTLDSIREQFEAAIA